MEPADFRRHAHALADWVADYLSTPERYPVLPRVSPGDVVRALPPMAPERGEPFEAIMADFERVLVPALTHWNHPGFFAYFAITASAPGILAEFLAAALNQQAMLWRTSPAATELEEVSLSWLRQLLGLPQAFEGVIYDTASISTLHALAAAREAAFPGARQHGLAACEASAGVRIYCSDHAHVSIDKAVILLGFGHQAVRRIPGDERFQMRPELLSHAIAEDRAAGIVPLAVVATIGTTSTTSVDPVRAISRLCRHEQLWLHVDAAYAGVAAMLPECGAQFDGWEHADSIVLNPHKWLFTPFDLSVLYSRRMDVVRQAFSLAVEYLETRDGARNLMDTGIQLGRRFRSLKLWMVLRHFGAEGIRSALREHLRLARLFAGWIERDARFELLAPVPFSVVCFSVSPGAVAGDEEAFNERLLERVNASGEVFLSHTRIDGRFALRLAIGHLRTEERHVARAWQLLRQGVDELKLSVREPQPR